MFQQSSDCSYFLFELPSNLMIRRIGTANWLSIIIICWGAVAIGMGFVHSWQLLAALRALLGCFEAGFFPGCVYLISCWYKRYEVQTRLAFFYMSSVFAAGFSAILAYGLSKIHTNSLAGWRFIFIVEGALTIAAAMVAWFFIVDFPQLAKFLNEDERARAVERLNKDRGDGEHDQITGAKVIKYLCDWKLWGFALIFFGTTAPCYALAYFAPVILLDMGFSVSIALLLVAPPYVLAVIVSLITSYWADKVRHRTPFIFCHSVIAIIGFALVASKVSNGVKLFGTFLAVAGANPNQPAALAFAQNNIVGTSKRAVGSALQVGFGAIGGIAASTVYRDRDAPRYLPGLIATMVFEVFAFSVAGLMAYYFHRKNEEADKEGKVLENTPGFRYTT
jgi:MFS family permease